VADMNFPVRITLTEGVIQYIMNLIKDEKVKPGEKLPSERDLGEQLSVSRSCIREALQALAMMRVIEIKPGRGAYVRSILPEEVIDSNMLSRLIQDDSLLEIIETRRILEVGIAGLAAKHRTQEDLRAIARVFDTVQSEHISVEELHRCSLDFHLNVARAAHNSVLMKVYSSIHPLLADSRTKLILVPGAREKSWVFHIAIFRAIEAGDEAEARRLMYEHLEVLREGVTAWMTAEASAAGATIAGSGTPVTMPVS